MASKLIEVLVGIAIIVVVGLIVILGFGEGANKAWSVIKGGVNSALESISIGKQVTPANITIPGNVTAAYDQLSTAFDKATSTQSRCLISVNAAPFAGDFKKFAISLQTFPDKDDNGADIVSTKMTILDPTGLRQLNTKIFKDIAGSCFVDAPKFWRNYFNYQLQPGQGGTSTATRHPIRTEPQRTPASGQDQGTLLILGNNRTNAGQDYDINPYLSTGKVILYRDYYDQQDTDGLCFFATKNYAGSAYCQEPTDLKFEAGCLEEIRSTITEC